MEWFLLDRMRMKLEAEVAMVGVAGFCSGTSAAGAFISACEGEYGVTAILGALGLTGIYSTYRLW